MPTNPRCSAKRREHEIGGVLGQVVEAGLARTLDAAAGEPAGADRRNRDWVTLYVTPPGSLAGFVKPVRRAVWYGFSTSTPAAGRNQRTLVISRTAPTAEDDEVQPPHPGQEQHRRQRCRVDEGSTEVGLEKDEAHRHETETDRRRDGAELADPAPPLHEEAGDRQHEEQLAELRRLELERAEIDPSLRPAHRLGKDEDEHHHPDRAAVQNPPVPLVDRRRHDDRDEHPGDAEGDRDRLARDEVVRIAEDVEPRDACDRPEPVADERRDREKQQPVEPPQDRGDVEGAERGRPEQRGTGSSVDDQSTFTSAWVPGAFWLKYFSKTRSAAGAAADDPWPPFSITAQTTSCASSDGPYPHHHA